MSRSETKTFFRAVAILLGAHYVLVVLGMGLGACGLPDGGGAAATDAANADASAGIFPPDGGTSAATDGSATEPLAYLRIAQLSPDTPSIDVCVAAHGTSNFTGPLLEQLADQDLLGQIGGPDGGQDSGSPGLGFGQVSTYLALSPGAYDVRLVAAGAGDCTLGLAVPFSGPRPTDDDAAAHSGADGSTSDSPDMDESALDAGTASAWPSADAADDTQGVADDTDADPIETGALDETQTEAGAADATVGSMQTGALDATNAGPDSADAVLDTETGVPARVADATNLSSLELGSYSTLIIAGDLTPAAADRALVVTLIADDSVLAGGAGALRAVNAVPSAASLDFGLGSFETTWLPLLTDVPFAAASAQAGTDDGAVDRNGYLPISAFSDEVMSARASSGATADTAVAGDVTIAVGSIATIAAIGGKTGDTAHPPALLLCVDNQPAAGLLSDCSLAP